MIMSSQKFLPKTMALARIKAIYPYFITFATGIAMLVIGVFFIEQIAFFNTEWNLKMNDSEFYLSFAAFMLSFSCFYFLCRRYFRTKVHPIALIIATVCFLSNLIAIIMSPSQMTLTRMGDNAGTIEVIYSFVDRGKDIILFGVSCIMMYSLFAIFPQITRNTHSLAILFYAMIAVGLVSIIYSLFTETSYYFAYFDGTPNKVPSTGIKSFTNNENTFATILLLAMLATGYLQTQRQHFWNYVLLHIFFIWSCLLYSLTGVILSALYLVFFIIYRFVHCLNEHLLSHFAGLAIYILIVTLVITFFNMGFIPVNNPLYKFLDRIKAMIAALTTEGTTLHGRTPIWGAIYQNMSGLDYVIGHGEFRSLVLIDAIVTGNMNAYSAHNGYIHIFFSGGVIRSLAYLVFIIYMFYLCIDTMLAKHTTIGFPSFLGLLIFCLHGIPETTAFFIGDTKGVMGFLMICLPVLIDKFQRKNALVDKAQDAMLDLPHYHIFFAPNPTYQATIASMVSTAAVIFPAVVVSLLRQNQNPFAMQFNNFGVYVIAVLTPMVFAIYVYNVAHLEKLNRYGYYVFMGVGLVVMTSLAVLTGVSVIDAMALTILDGVILFVYLIVALALLSMRKPHWNLQLIRVLAEFFVFNAGVLIFTCVRRFIQFDIQYFTVAYAFAVVFLFYLLMLFGTSHDNFMSRLRIQVCQAELKIHRLALMSYSTQQAYDEAYRTGMKVIVKHNRYDYK